MLPSLITSIALLGTIAAPAGGVAAFKSGGEEAEVVREGATIDGWTLERVEPRAVTLRRGAELRRIGVGDTPDEEPPMQGVTVKGTDIVLSQDTRDHISGPGLAKILMQAAATRVDGGYMISDIDAGSIYDLVGLRDGDIVKSVDQQELGTPLAAVAALQRVAALDKFTVEISRAGAPVVLSVVVR